VEKVERYLKSQTAHYRHLGDVDAAHEAHPFVTISRQAGTGGQALAEVMVRTFDAQSDTELFGGWQVFDRRLCEMVADHPRLSESLESLVTEEYRTRTDEFVRQVLRPGVDQEFVMRRVFHVVASVAAIGKAVIVGRAGSHVTAGLGPAVRLRLVAPEADRIARLMEVLGVEERDARDEARRLDASRARLLKAQFHADIDDPTCYDAVWNTASATGDEIAAAVVTLLRHRAIACSLTATGEPT